ncbi:MAG: hypothetical protein V8S14_07670 [Lachnospiraceae bacterium]
MKKLTLSNGKIYLEFKYGKKVAGEALKIIITHHLFQLRFQSISWIEPVTE